MKRGPSSCERNLRNSVSSLRKRIRVFNGIVTRDLAIPVRYSNLLSYEATDVERTYPLGLKPILDSSNLLD